MNLKQFLQKNNKIDNHTFGKFISQRREELGLTQRELATKLEISNTYMWDIENGHRSPPAKLISQLKEILKINIDETDKYAFDDLKVNAVWCGRYEGNEKSKRVQEKLGFVFHHTTEGLIVPQVNEVRTGHVMLMTKENWYNFNYEKRG